ncbi:MAG: hypothetical protein GWP58_14530 [Gammaproteobacteria bacterium]|jgi:hypothetical protein|nr:hypothetical protein [Gammaproteobacteria bacterium]
MSIFTGRTHSTLMVPRVELGLPYLDEMDDESRGMLRDQLLLAWALKPGELIRVLKRRDSNLGLTRELIGPAEEAVLAEMERRVEKAR